MVFVLDNYDSFTYNLVQYMGELGAEMVVRRNDELTPTEVEALRPERIVISPGPCTPQDAGISIELIKHFARAKRRVPILGVCLGHQAIGAAFGGNVVRATKLMHGKTSEVEHDGKTIFAGLAFGDDLHAVSLADCVGGWAAGGAGDFSADGGWRDDYGTAASRAAD